MERIVRDASPGRVWLIEKADKPIGYMVLTFGYSLEYRGREAGELIQSYLMLSGKARAKRKSFEKMRSEFNSEMADVFCIRFC